MKRTVCLLALALLAGASGCRESQTIVNNYADGLGRAPESARKMRVETDLGQIRRAIEFFHGQHGRFPESLEELASKGIIQRIPHEASGGTWQYDPSTGEIRSSTYPEL